MAQPACTPTEPRMDLKSGYPYWAIKNGLMHAFPPLQEDLRCDVVVIGAGITGALIADELSNHGHAVVVLDQRDAGWGSTSASTALLQYEIDTHMVDLAEQYGEENAVLAYRSCADAIDMLADKASSLKKVDFSRMQSLYYASNKRHRKDLRHEFELREKHGFDVSWLEPDEVQAVYGFDAPCAILSGKAARVDPYQLAYGLLERIERNGARIHDRSPVARILANARGVEVHTTQGAVVNAKYLVMAAGYESQRFISQRVAQNRSSYAFITDPIAAEVLGPLSSTMVWESARPYLYMRTTSDNRLLVGGDDDTVDIPAKRDALVKRKVRKLAEKVAKLFPEVPVEPAFAWGGTFAETEDGLPWFGAHEQHGPRVLFAMAYGGNGITYSMLGAGLLRAQIERKKHPLSALFGFSRAK